MDIGLFVTGLLGSAGLFSLIQFLVTRHDTKKSDLTGIKKELADLNASQLDTKIRVTRIELTNLMQNDPDNLDAILQVAETYFIEMDGNAYIHAMFEKWANAHGVAIGWLPKLKKGVRNGTKYSAN